MFSGKLCMLDEFERIKHDDDRYRWYQYDDANTISNFEIKFEEL